MYVPGHFKPLSPELVTQVISRFPFGILISEGFHATHIPMELVSGGVDEKGVLMGHLSAANPHGKILHKRQSLAVFSGPHCYVSSSWYGHVNVPTWNYIAVHVHGRTEILTEEESYDLIKNQLDRYETDSKNPVKMESLPEQFVRSHMKGIICFRLIIDRIESSFKMSQNRNDEDYQSIIRELEGSGDTSSKEVAAWMRKIRDVGHS